METNRVTQRGEFKNRIKLTSVVLVGKLLRWASRASLITENILLLNVGLVSANNFPYLFQTYTFVQE